MALFKSAEEKAQIAQDKEQALLEKYGLENMGNAKDAAAVRKIAQELTGSGLMEAGLKISMAKAEVQLPISYQRAMVEQNFIIIRQLDKLAKLLEK